MEKDETTQDRLFEKGALSWLLAALADSSTPLQVTLNTLTSQSCCEGVVRFASEGLSLLRLSQAEKLLRIQRSDYFQARLVAGGEYTDPAIRILFRKQRGLQSVELAPVHGGRSSWVRLVESAQLSTAVMLD